MVFWNFGTKKQVVFDTTKIMLEEKKLKDEELDQVSGGEKWYESYPIQTGSEEQSSQTNNIDSAGAKSASAEKASIRIL